jgi:histidinol phosphatase-like PHP family hydrolase
MFDLHTHTILSDGVLVPAEMTRRCQALGYRGLVLSDHCDHSNIEHVVGRTVEFCESVNGHYGDLQVVPGCEITHVPPPLIRGLVVLAREIGAEVVLVHGETIVEPVAEGTNRAAIEAGCDVLAHPGLVEPDDVALAAQEGVMLEISGRKGHCFTNGHVARLALEAGARLAFGSDGHAPGDYPSRSQAEAIARGAGLTSPQVEKLFENTAGFFSP